MVGSALVGSLLNISCSFVILGVGMPLAIIAALVALVVGFFISHAIVNGQNSAKVQDANRQVSEAQQRAEQICADA